MTTNVDIITALVHKLDHENTRLRAENEALRAGQGRWPDEAQKLRIRSEHLTIGTFSAPRVITADELRAGQAVARKPLNHGYWRLGMVFWNVGINGWSMNAPHFDGTDEIDIGIGPETIVLLEDAPVKNVDTTPATWEENGENFTRPTTVHALNTAPVGSVAVKSPGSIFTPMQKVHSGKWVTVGDGPMNTRVQWSAEDLIEYGWADATLTYPERGDHE